MLKAECRHFRDQAASGVTPHGEVCEACGVPGPPDAHLSNVLYLPL